MEHDSSIDAKLREVDYATERIVDYFTRRMPAEFDIGVEGVSKINDVGRLTRELAKVSQERMRYRAYSEQGTIVMGRPAWNAVLPLEGVEDENVNR